MPAIINICANLLFGAAVAWTGRRSRELREELLTWHLLLLLAFESLFVTPIATFLFRFYPQWSMLYWFDPQLFPNLDQSIGWLSGLVVVLNYLAALAGYGLARWGVIRANLFLQATPAVAAVGSMVAVLVVFGDRVAFIGDYDAFLQGQADILMTRLAGWVGLALYAGGVIFVLWVRARFGQEVTEP